MFWKILTSGAGGSGAFNFEEFSGAHIVEEAVDRNGFGDERMITDAGDVIDHGLLLVADREPLDVFTGAGARALANILETLRGERRGFEARGKQIANGVAGEEFHAAIGVVNDEEFASAKQFVTYNERPNGVVAGSPAGVANDVSVAFGQACVFGGIKARVHARENGEAAPRGGIEPPIMVLQTIALPLGDRAAGVRDLAAKTGEKSSPPGPCSVLQLQALLPY